MGNTEEENINVEASAEEVAPESVEGAEPEVAAEKSLETQLAEAELRAADNNDQLMRAKAELDNYKKRRDKELQNAHKFALEKFSVELLTVRDSLEMGLASATQDGASIASIIEGTELTLKQLSGAMEKFNVVQVNPEGEKFNPELHQAITMQESDAEPNTVLTVIQKGYTLNDRLIRPAMVVVSKKSSRVCH